MVEYRGLQHFPIGNAQLNVEGENLNVSGLSTCGDGFFVRTPNITDWELRIEGIEITDNRAITTSLVARDGFNRLKNIAQSSIYVNEDGQSAVAVNSRMMGKTIKLTAMLNGEVVFEEEYDNPSCGCPDTYDSPENWLLIALVALALLTLIDFDKTTEKEGGEVTKETTRISMGTGGSSRGGGGGDNEGTIFTDRNGTEFRADHIFIESSFAFNPPIDSKYENIPDHVNIETCNIEQLTLKDELFSTEG